MIVRLGVCKLQPVTLLQFRTAAQEDLADGQFNLRIDLRIIFPLELFTAPIDGLEKCVYMCRTPVWGWPHL